MLIFIESILNKNFLSFRLPLYLTAFYFEALLSTLPSSILVLGCGLALDVLYGLPLGLSAVTYFALLIFILLQRSYILNNNRATRFLFFMIVFALKEILQTALLSLALRQITFSATFLEEGLTAALLYGLCEAGWRTLRKAP